MIFFNMIIYILIGAIGGRAIVNKDWATLVLTLVLFAVVVVNEWCHDRGGLNGHTD